MDGAARNQQPTSTLTLTLTSEDVDAAVARLTERDASLGRDVQHIYESLTWGEGPHVIRLSGLQQWLWYVVPTKYMTDEPNYMQ